MKKIFYAFLVAAMAAVSCSKDPIENTAAVNVAGDWYVLFNQVDANGDIVYEDGFGIGYSHVLTYNTSSNSVDSIFVDDLKNTWEFKAKVPVDMSNMTFGSSSELFEYYSESGVYIYNGKILPGAATTPSGMLADSIVFEVKFDGDAYAESYGYDHYRLEGYRYTGFDADE